MRREGRQKGGWDWKEWNNEYGKEIKMKGKGRREGEGEGREGDCEGWCPLN
jgi:hypothetical protein